VAWPLERSLVRWNTRRSHENQAVARPGRGPLDRGGGAYAGRRVHSRYPKEKPIQGEVLAVGPGGRDESGKRIRPDVEEGDTILFGKWSGTEVKMDGEELLIMKESDIMGIVEGKSAAARKSRAA
jgi:chaperonin GroES